MTCYKPAICDSNSDAKFWCLNFENTEVHEMSKFKSQIFQMLISYSSEYLYSIDIIFIPLRQKLTEVLSP